MAENGDHPEVRWWATVAALALAAAAPGQYINRATWLGVEDESVRRDFQADDEYFLDRFGYVVLPPWWSPDLDSFRNRALFMTGSVSTRFFTVEAAYDHRLELGEGFHFNVHALQSENRDTRFLRTAVGLEYDLSPSASLFAETELFAAKSDVDVSVGAYLFRSEAGALRLMGTAVDIPNEKTDRFEYGPHPLALMASGWVGAAGGPQLSFEIDAQLPFRAQDYLLEHALAMERYIGIFEGRLPVDESDTLVGTLELEYTDKELSPYDPASLLREDFERQFATARLEWWRSVGGGVEWSLGGWFLYLDEEGIRWDDPQQSLRLDREEWFATARSRLPLSEQFAFEPQLFAGYVRFDELIGDGQPGSRSRHGFQGKLNLNTVCRFSKGAQLSLVIGLQLDEPSFGGGGAQFVAYF